MATNAILVAGALLLVLGGLEAYFRLWSPQRSDPGGMFVPHPELGWTFAADRRGAIVYPGEAAHYLQTNAQGFRDDPFDSVGGEARRIAVLGDSFVSNISVERDEVFTERIERSLSGVSVMNLGVNGYGQVQELLLLERVLWELSPDLVVVNVYLRNDFGDNLGRWWSPRLSRPTASLSAAGDVTIEPPRKLRGREADTPARMERPFGDSLHTAHFLRTRLAFLSDRLIPASSTAPASERPPQRAGTPRSGRRRSRFAPPELTLCAVEPDAETERSFRTLGALLLELSARGRESGVPVVFSLAPSMLQVIPELWESVAAKALEEGTRLDADLPNRELLAFAKDHDLAMLDLLPPLRAAQQGGESTYNRIEQHWTAAGNRVVAEALHAFLSRDPASRAALGLGAP